MGEENVRVTIIVPVFNAENTLTDCVAAICAQSEKNIQIILVDDCSSDSSFKKCKELAKNDDRIEIYAQDRNKGPSAARNVGIAHAKGEYVYFCDADDKMALDCIEFLEKNLSEENVDMAVCSYYVDGQEVQEKNKTPMYLTPQ